MAGDVSDSFTGLEYSMSNTKAITANIILCIWGLFYKQYLSNHMDYYGMD